MVNIPTNSGRSFRMPSVPRKSAELVTSGVGAGAKKLANAGFDLAEEFAEAQIEQDVVNANNEATKRLNDLSFEMEKEGGSDFIQGPEDFKKRARDIASEIGSGLGSDRAKKEFQKRFDRQVEPRRTRLRDVYFGNAKNENRANLSETLDGYQQAAGLAHDPREIATYGQLADDAIDKMRAANWISAAEATRYKAGFRETLQQNFVSEMIADNPSRALKFLNDDKQLEDLSPNKRASLKLSAKREVRRIETARRIERNSEKVLLRSEIKEISSVSRAGLPVDADLLTAARERAARLNDSRLTRALTRAEKIIDFQHELTTKTPAEAAQLLSEKETRAGQEGADGDLAAEVLAGRQTVIRMVRDIKRDPLSYAKEGGFIELEPLDFGGSTEDVSAQLVRRAQQADQVSEHYNIGKRFFTAPEVSVLSNALDQASPQEREQIIKTISTGLGSQAPLAFSELGVKQQSISFLGQMAASTGDDYDGVLRDGVEGIDVLKNKSVQMPDARQLKDISAEVLGGALDGRMIQTRARMIDAAKMVYAARALRAGREDFDEKLFRSSLQAVAGRTSPDGPGGIGQYNGRKILLPKYMDEGDFSSAIENMRDWHLEKLSFHGGRAYHVNVRGQKVFAKADDLFDAHYVSVGHGQYQVSMTNPGLGPAQYWMDDKTGQYFVLDLSDPALIPEPMRQDFKGAAP